MALASVFVLPPALAMARVAACTNGSFEEAVAAPLLLSPACEPHMKGRRKDDKLQKENQDVYTKADIAEVAFSL